MKIVTLFTDLREICGTALCIRSGAKPRRGSLIPRTVLEPPEDSYLTTVTAAPEVLKARCPPNLHPEANTALRAAPQIRPLGT